MKHNTWIALALLFVVETAQGVSFDCTKAQSKVEHLICDTPELSELDDDLAASYKIATQDKSQVAAVKLAQRKWMRVRSNCTDVVCIKITYSDRIRELKKAALPIDDLNTCTGDAKRNLDLAVAEDEQVQDVVRKITSGRLNDGSLNFGVSYLRPDISLMYAKLHCWRSAQEMIGKIVPNEDQERAKAKLAIEYAKAGYFNTAIAVLDTLKSEEASSESVYGIAEALVVAGRIDQAKEVIMRVTTRWNHMESPSYMLIKFLLDAGRIGDAERMTTDIGGGWNEQMLLATAYMKAKKKEAAESHIQKAIGFTDTTADEADVDLDENETSRNYLADHISGWTVSIYIDGHEFDKAYQSASAIAWKLDKLQALLRLAEAQHRAGNVPRSAEIYAEAIRVMLNIKSKGKEGESDVNSACSYITQSYAKVGNVEKAISTVASYCPGVVHEAVSYGYAINELANSNNIEGALFVQAKLDVMWRNSEDGPIAAALARKGEYELAAAKARGIENEFIRANTVRRMASVTPPPKIVESWLEDAQTIKSNEMQAAAIQTLTAALARSKNSAVAMNWLDRQPSGHVKARGYLGVTQGLLGIVPGTGSPGD